MNIQKMMKQAQEMQKKMEDAQGKLADIEVSGSAGGGMVEVTLNCKHEARGVKLDPKVVDADDVEMLEDLIVAAINDAVKKVEATSGDEMSKVTAGMQLPPGMGF
jgi:DNA-binding YbaB/EbfC family protein